MATFIISSWLLFSVDAAQAQTAMKFKIFNNVVKVEMMPFPDEKGHAVGVVSREGLAVLENGEVGKQSAVLTFDAKGNTLTFDAVTTIIFPDASSFVFKTKGTGETKPEEKTMTTKQTGDFLRGTGKYEGIKGSITIIGKQYGPAEVGKGYWIGNVTATYTLPSK
jgi:hypothetical protein